MTTLAELDTYVQKLNSHDWTYDYSDDMSVYRKGKASEATIEAGAKADPVLQAVYNAYTNARRGSTPWTERKLIRDAIVEGLRTDLKVAATTELITPKETV